MQESIPFTISKTNDNQQSYHCDNMSDDLVKFLSQYASFTDEEMQIIKEQSVVQEFAKGKLLLRQGQQARNSYLVLKGCVRSYYIKEGEEKNTEFFIEHDLILPVSYIRNTPSEYYIECLEDCLLSVGSSERSRQFMQEHPRLAPMCAKINEDIMAKRQISWDKFHNLTPEEHYLEILKHKPDLLRRVPQYHLASYLGIKPQSLSRIRKRLTVKA